MTSTLNVKSLRLRLGWTQSDLSRRLGCEASEISHWESGLSVPSANYIGTLQLLFSQAEACALDLQTLPRAEIFCDQQHVEQINMLGFGDFKKN